MPVRFTEQERERITEQLLETGRRLFTTQGLRRTTLEELVAPAGIATSSFYAFFKSKESLYLELMIRQAPEVYPRVTAALDPSLGTRDALVAFLRRGFETGTTNPLYQRLTPQEAAMIARRVGPEEMARLEPVVMRPLLDFIHERQERGELAQGDPMVILGVFRALPIVYAHAEELGPSFPIQAVIDLLTRAVATGLTSEPLVQEGN